MAWWKSTLEVAGSVDYRELHSLLFTSSSLASVGSIISFGGVAWEMLTSGWSSVGAITLSVVTGLVRIEDSTGGNESVISWAFDAQ